MMDPRNHPAFNDQAEGQQGKSDIYVITNLKKNKLADLHTCIRCFGAGLPPPSHCMLLILACQLFTEVVTVFALNSTYHPNLVRRAAQFSGKKHGNIVCSGRVNFHPSTEGQTGCGSNRQGM